MRSKSEAFEKQNEPIFLVDMDEQRKGLTKKELKKVRRTSAVKKNI